MTYELQENGSYRLQKDDCECFFIPKDTLLQFIKDSSLNTIISDFEQAGELKHIETTVTPKYLFENDPDYVLQAYIRTLKDCTSCEGTGKNIFSCCGERINSDYKRCPECHEFCDDEESCDHCNGTGVDL